MFQPVLERTKTLLKVPFQALFQPAELEQDLHSKPPGKWVFWIHIVLTLVFYTVLTLALASVFKEERDRWTSSLWIGIGIYLVSLLVAFVFGGVFKRGSHLSFLIGTYWGWIFGLLLFGMLATAQKNEEIREIMIAACFPLFLAVSGALIANVRGRTGGIRVASYLVIAAIAGYLVISFFDQKQEATLNYMEGRNPGRGLLLLSFPKLKFDFSVIFLKVSIKSVTYAVDRAKAESAPLILVYTLDLWTISESLLRSALKKNPTVSEPAPQVMDKLINLKVVGDPTDWNFSDVNHPRELFTAIEGVVGSDKELIKLAAEAAKRGVAVTIDGEQYVENYLNTKLTFENEIPFMESLEKGQITASEGYVSVPAINGLTFEVTKKDISLLRRDSQGVVKKSAQIPGTQVGSALMLGASRLYVQTDQAFQAFGIEHNGLAPLWRQAEQSWLRSVWGSYSSARLYDRKRGSRAVLVGNSIYSISPSGYLFALAAEDGSLMFRRPLYDFTALSAKMGAAIAAFYIPVGIVSLGIGLYQIPVYLLETLLQFAGLVRLRRKPRNLDRAVAATPMFFDHVSTLPPAFGRAILREIASADPKACAQRLVYLFTKTQHRELAARFFEEFHESNTGLLFHNLYQRLRSGQYGLVQDFARVVSVGTPVGTLVRAYADLIAAASKKPQLEHHESLLKKFADRSYRHAEELWLTYRAFRTFLELDSLQALASADEVLADPLKIPYGEVLNPQVFDAFNIIVEMANDLRNYDVVDSFRDKQYYLSEARIKLYEISRKAREQQQPEQDILLEVVQCWQGLVVAEAKSLRGPADLDLSVLNESLAGTEEWHSVLVNLKNVGQSPAENIRVRLLENENMHVQEIQKIVHLLGTEDSIRVEFAIHPRGNPTELRMVFDTEFDDFQRKNKRRPFANTLNLSSDVQEFRRVPNPYIVGIPLQSPKMFFGRQKVLNFAIDNLSAAEQNNALIFFGQRRVGKSSILYRLMETPLAEQYVFVYIDCQGFAEDDTATLLYRLCREISASATKRQVPLGGPDLHAFKSDPFLELDAYLDRTESALGSKKCVLMFDEYEFLEYKVKEGHVSNQIFNKLRNLIQHRNKRFAFIFVGTHQLTELTEDYWSVLFNIALYHEIGPLSPEAARALITDPVNGYIRYDELAVNKILLVTGLHPYFIQVTCRLIVNYCNRNEKPYVTLQAVKEILKEAVEGSTAHVKYLYKDFATKPEQAALAFLSRVTDESKLFASVTEIGRYAKEAEFDYDQRQLREILSGLKNKKLVREDGEVRGELFGFEYEFLRFWIEEHVKIQKGFVTIG